MIVPNGLGRFRYMTVLVQRGGQFRYMMTSVNMRSILVHVFLVVRLTLHVKYRFGTLQATFFMLKVCKC